MSSWAASFAKHFRFISSHFTHRFHRSRCTRADRHRLSMKMQRCKLKLAEKLQKARLSQRDRATLHGVWKSYYTLTFSYCCPSPPVDIVWAIMTVRRKRGKIIRTVLCCVVSTTVVHNHTHTHIWAVLNDECWIGLSVDFLCLFTFSILCIFFWLSLDCFVFVLFTSVVLGHFLQYVNLPGDWLERTSPKWPILRRVKRYKP